MGNETNKKMNASGTKWILLSSLLVSFLLIISFMVLYFIDSKYDTCDSRVKYNDQSYDIKAATKLLSLDIRKKSKATESVSNLLKIYFDQSAQLCSGFIEGRIEGKEYRKELIELGKRFSLLVKLQENTPASQISNDQQLFYMESLDLLRPDAPFNQAEIRYRVISGDKILKNGAILRTSDQYYIDIDLPNKQFLYVIMIDSSDGVYRLYPSKITGKANPIKGKIRIPRDDEKFFELDTNAGVERILIFAQSNSSKAIEDQIPSVGTVENTISKRKADILLNTIRTRGVFVNTIKSESESSASAHVSSILGQAVSQFIIDHRHTEK